MNPLPSNPAGVEVSASFDAIQDYYEEQGWTDGLPVVPATEDLVRKMLLAYGEDPAASLGVVQPRNAQVTLEKVAINGGDGRLAPGAFSGSGGGGQGGAPTRLHIASVQAPPAALPRLIIVNGPIANQLGITAIRGVSAPATGPTPSLAGHCGSLSATWPVWLPGEMDKATLALPARYTFCFAENEERSPWEPRHVELGLDPSASMVTLTGIRGMYTIMESTSPPESRCCGRWLVPSRTIGFSNYYQTGTGAQMTLVLCPEHAAEIHASGLSKQDVREYVFQNAPDAAQPPQGYCPLR